MLIGHFKQAFQPLHLYCPPDHCTITPVSLSLSLVAFILDYPLILMICQNSSCLFVACFTLSVCFLVQIWGGLSGEALLALCVTLPPPFPTEEQTAVSANTDAVSGKIPGLCVSSNCELVPEKDKCLYCDIKEPTAGPILGKAHH